MTGFSIANFQSSLINPFRLPAEILKLVMPDSIRHPGEYERTTIVDQEKSCISCKSCQKNQRTFFEKQTQFKPIA